MQTFLPYSDYDKSAQHLDYRRLGNQRNEAKGILTSIEKQGGWINHPAVRMWIGYEASLCKYAIAICKEWVKRGYNDTQMAHFQVKLNKYSKGMDVTPTPLWIGDDRLHASHRSNLLRKKPEFYSKFGWSESPDLPYFWPTKEGYGQ